MIVNRVLKGQGGSGDYASIFITGLQSTDTITCTSPSGGSVSGSWVTKTVTVTDQPLIPTMTGYTTPSGAASGSPSDRSAMTYWHPFASNAEYLNDSVGWATNTSGTTSGWLQYQFTSSQKFTELRYGRPDGYCPESVQVLGSNNGTDWDTLATYNATNYSVVQIISISTQNEYSYIRLNILSNFSGGTIAICKMQVYGDVSSQVSGWEFSNLDEYGTYTLQSGGKTEEVLVDSAECFEVEWVGNTTYLYYLGDECEELTGGYTKTLQLKSTAWFTLAPQGVFEPNYIEMSGSIIAPSNRNYKGYVCTNNKIDIANYVGVFFKVDTNSGSGSTYCGVSQTAGVYCVSDSSSEVRDSWRETASNGTHLYVKTKGSNIISNNEYLFLTSENWNDYKAATQYYAFGIYKSDDISGLSTYGATISAILANASSLMADTTAVNYMASHCTGDFMWSALANSGFVSAMNASANKSILSNNTHWAKALALL